MGIGSFIKWAFPGFITKPIGAAGKWIGNKIDSNAGVIGKHLGSFGENAMAGPQRWLVKNIADFAINRLPKGNVKDTLTKISNAAQGKITLPKGQKQMTDMFKPSYMEKKQNWNNPTHEPHQAKENLVSMGDG